MRSNAALTAIATRVERRRATVGPAPRQWGEGQPGQADTLA